MKVIFRKKLYVALAILFICAKVFCAQKFNQVVNIFHHVGEKNAVYQKNLQNLQSQNTDFNNIELGNLVFYFESKPVVSFIPDREKDGALSKKVFIFPFAQIKDDKLLKKINDAPARGYKLLLERISSPIKGIKLTFFYDLDKIAFDYKFFDSINNHKGVVFNFYNKSLIDKLRNLDDRILRTVEGKKKIVVVDLGHGGADFGAVGKFGLVEKDLAMSIGLKVKDILKKKGYDVFVTRDFDQDVMLDTRTSFANNFISNNKILISIHANSSVNVGAMGLETFFLEDSLFSNEVFFYGPEEQNFVKNYFGQRNKKSSVLAQCLHKNIYDKAKKKAYTYKDRGVKKSVSQLLLGSHMPASLIEVGFVSCQKESTFLKNKKNHEVIAQGICDGIVDYFNLQ